MGNQDNVAITNSHMPNATFIAPSIPAGKNNVYLTGLAEVITPNGDNSEKPFIVNVSSKNAVLPQPPRSLTAEIQELGPDGFSASVSWIPFNIIQEASYKLYVAEEANVSPENYYELTGGTVYDVSGNNITLLLDIGKTYYATVIEKLGEVESIPSNQISFVSKAMEPIGTKADTVSAGGDHTCAVLTNGTIRCWGANFFGQLGDNSTNHSSVPVTVMGISTAEQVSSGNFHSCAVLTNGTVKCWGSNFFWSAW